MSKALFVVIFSRGSWWVDFEGRAEGPHESLERAVEEARQSARLIAHTGRETEVLVPDESGRYSVVWSSLNEPHAMAVFGATHAAE